MGQMNSSKLITEATYRAHDRVPLILQCIVSRINIYMTSETFLMTVSYTVVHVIVV